MLRSVHPPIAEGAPRWRWDRPLTAAAPTLLAAGFVLTVFADDGTHLAELWRPLWIAIALALGLQMLATLLLRSSTAGTVAALIAILALMSLPLGIIALATAIALELARRWGRPFMLLPGAAVVISIFFGLGMVRAAAAADLEISSIATAANSPIDGDPDIYLILLDGYPRSDTLSEEAGYDNTWFESSLEQRGFDMSPRSRGNYPFTAQVMLSMLHGRHVEDLAEDPSESSIEQRRQAQRLLVDNPTFDQLLGRGYEIRWLPENHSRITGLEHQIFIRTALWGLVMEPLILPDHQRFVLDTLDEAMALDDSGNPVFSLVHVLSPHTPFVFDRDGDLPADLDYIPLNALAIDREFMGFSETDFWAAYADQVHYLNGRVLELVDEIVDASPDAVVVVFSDHGARATSEVSDEWYRTFLAARTPGHSALLADDARAQEVIPAVFDAYFGIKMTVPPDVTYIAPGGALMPLTVERTR